MKITIDQILILVILAVTIYAINTVSSCELKETCIRNNISLQGCH